MASLVPARTTEGLIARTLRVLGLQTRAAATPAEWSNDPTLSHIFSSWQTAGGKTITVETALRAAAVLACARVIAEGVAQVPRSLRKRDPADPHAWIEDESHWLARLMRAPNQWQTGFEFVELLTMHAVLTGDGFAFKNRIGTRIKELLPLDPGGMTVSRDAEGNLAYRYRVNGQSVALDAADVFHIRGPSWSGIRGLQAFDVAREAIGLALATEESHSRMHQNGVRLSGVLTSDMPLSTDAAGRIKEAWNETYSKPENWHKVAVLEGAMKFVPFSQTGADAQHIETRRFQIEEICRVMRVNPLMVMQADKAPTYASAEQFFLAHVTHTLGPWVERWAQRCDVSLLAPSTEPNTWLHFELRGLSPGDATARGNFYSQGINAGWLEPNEARAFEGLNPRAGGYGLRAPLNMTPATATPAPKAPADETANP